MPLSDTLPPYVRDIVMSDEFIAVKNSWRESLHISLKQKAELELIIEGLFDRSIKPEQLREVCTARMGLTDDVAKALEKELFTNLVLPLSSFFGDHFEHFKNNHGDPIKALEESKTMPVLIAYLLGELREPAKRIEEFQLREDQEARDMFELFKKGIVDFLGTPDGPHKVALNNTLILLINDQKNFPDALLKALYENEERIGTQTIRVGDQEGVEPTAAHWIQDFLGSSKGAVSSITIAQYLTNSQNAKKLSAPEQETARRLLETVRRLLEMFVILKNFPESFQKTSVEHWQIIPFYADTQTPSAPSITVSEASAKPVVSPPPTPPVQESRPVAKPVITPPVEVPVIPPIQPAAPVLPEPPKVTVAPLPAVPIDFDVVADTAVQKSGIILADDARERVKKIVVTRVRNVRNVIDTKERLSAATAEGGAGLTPEEAENILQEANRATQMIVEGKAGEYVLTVVNQESGIRNQGTQTSATEGAAEIPPKMVIKEVDGVPTIVEKKTNGGKKDSQQKTMGEVGSLAVREQGGHDASNRAGDEGRSDLVTPPSLPAPPPVTVPKHLEDAQVIPVVVRAQPTQLVTPAQKPQPETQHLAAVKKPIADVKAPPRLVGVVDELRALTIKDIRRISQDPGAACQKIADKINALAKESLSKRAEAINAWKESPAYALYLEIGQLNLTGDMQKLIEDRKAAGKEYLTNEEFEALLDMNEKLRF